MRYVVFRTPGPFDMGALDFFGMSAKPNAKSPIGFFGTGLKISIGVLMRNNIPFEIYSGNNHYKFYTKKTDFRDKQFDTVRYRKTDMWAKLGARSYHDLPFTTEIGKNWELWQAFRELYANTLDENGHMVIHDDIEWLKKGQDIDQQNFTYMVVDSVDFAKIAENVSSIFLPDHMTKTDVDVAANGVRKGVLYKDSELIIYDQPNEHIYYRGMRAYDLNNRYGVKRSLFTYNYTGTLELTEDRTIKYLFYVQDKIRTAIMSTSYRPLIERCIKAPKDSLEATIDFGTYYNQPSPIFNEVIRYTPPIYLTSGASAYKSKDEEISKAKAKDKSPTIEESTWTTLLETLSEAEKECTQIEEHYSSHLESSDTLKIVIHHLEKKFNRQLTHKKEYEELMQMYSIEMSTSVPAAEHIQAVNLFPSSTTAFTHGTIVNDEEEIPF